MNERDAIGELDLLAYADDPRRLASERREAVERHLRGHPEDAARVDVFRRQNLALRERYDRYLDAPVPRHLYDALEVRPARGRRLLRHAAAACVIAATAAAGWVAGDRYGGPALLAIDQETPSAANPGSSTQWAGDSKAAQPVAVAGLLEYGGGLPELGHLGYSLVQAEPAGSSSSEDVRLTYAGEGGRRFTLLLRSRWNDQNPGFQVEKRDGLSVVSWEEGRLAAELTSGVSREEALEIAEAVRASLKSLRPADPVTADGRVTVGTAGSAEAIDAGAPVLPQQIQ